MNEGFDEYVTPDHHPRAVDRTGLVCCWLCLGLFAEFETGGPAPHARVREGDVYCYRV